ncbi:hypothetical protein LTR37_007284 [Vermiconidia calcicola]|uniref:Uncharacterized protein n=1 Tax=Vermiconidia calcicola TaxID=1690605 RepID=A0ACC3NFY7_9PEZI|nr:hypothetical protein LTR37_007284 [Vermiconidia calcicola]
MTNIQRKPIAPLSREEDQATAEAEESRLIRDMDHIPRSAIDEMRGTTDDRYFDLRTTQAELRRILGNYEIQHRMPTQRDVNATTGGAVTGYALTPLQQCGLFFAQEKQLYIAVAASSVTHLLGSSRQRPSAAP